MYQPVQMYNTRIVRWAIYINVLSHQLMFVLSVVYGNIVQISSSIRLFSKTFEPQRCEDAQLQCRHRAPHVTAAVPPQSPTRDSCSAATEPRT